MAIHSLQLSLHLLNVGHGPLCWIDASFNGGILSRQTKSIPAHWMYRMVSTESPESRENVRDGVDPDVTHMQRSRRVRKHGQNVLFLSSYRALLLPHSLPFVPPFLVNAWKMKPVLIVVRFGRGNAPKLREAHLLERSASP